ncbi:hypothetical protein [Streptomyces sp. OE57]|uniref:hypothetical protein n=1 Tax=Streptomyces lacaronensis TaxID=3379885 RepID=UPI0039B7919D
MTYIEINGSPATADTLRLPALSSYGHFTAMQIRDARVRGLGLHLERLRSATRELFDGDLHDERVRADVRHAPDAPEVVEPLISARPPDERIRQLTALPLTTRQAVRSRATHRPRPPPRPRHRSSGPPPSGRASR